MPNNEIADALERADGERGGWIARELAKEAQDWRHNAYSRVVFAQLHDRLTAFGQAATLARTSGKVS